MSWFSKLFRRKSPPPSVQIRKYLSDTKAISNTVSRQLDLVFQSKVVEILPEKAPDFQLVLASMEVVSLPSVSFRFMDYASKKSLSSFMTARTRDSLLQAMLLPGFRPAKEMYKKFLMQDEVSQMIGKGLEQFLMEFNKKLNPFSGLFQATGMESQVHKALQGFLPQMQSSLADYLSEMGSDPSQNSILKNSLDLVLHLTPSDFLSPGEEEWNASARAWNLVWEDVKKDPVFQSEMIQLWTSLYTGIRKEFQDSYLKDLLFAGETEYRKFLTEISMGIAESISQKEKESQKISMELEMFWNEIQNSKGL